MNGELKVSQAQRVTERSLREASKIGRITKLAYRTSSPKGIVRFWSRWKAPLYGEIHRPPLCCTTRTGHTFWTDKEHAYSWDSGSLPCDGASNISLRNILNRARVQQILPRVTSYHENLKSYSEYINVEAVANSHLPLTFSSSFTERRYLIRNSPRRRGCLERRVEVSGKFP